MIPILGGLIGLGQTWLESRAKKQLAKAEAEAEVMKQASKDVSEWEQLMAKGSMTSWKDEYWTIVLSIPVVMCFVPSTQDIVFNGFAALAKTPEWFQYLLYAAVLASFGLRGIQKFRG